MTSLPFADHPAHIQAILQAALNQANPQTAVRQHLQKKGSHLHIGPHRIALGDGRLFILSLGKAAVPMALAAVDVVGETAVAGGGIIAKHLPETALPLPAFIGSHPVPDEKSEAATTAVLEPLAALTEKDTVLCLISGGASALFTRPHLPLAQWQALNRALLASGCPIQAINTVRRQLDVVKGGGLARWVAPARIISLILSDVVGNELAAIGSGPTVASQETPAEALAVWQCYHVDRFLDTAVAHAITTTLQTLAETEFTPPTNIVANLIIGSIQQSAQAAAAKAESLGFQTRLLTTRLEGEAREVGKFAAALASDAPSQSATLLGGETTVTLRGKGKGGRNLETALAAAIGMAGWSQRTITSFATDGDDGTSGVAGATVTGQTVKDGETAVTYLDNNDSYTFFQQLDTAGRGPHLIKTGPTGTNVNDLLLILNYEM
ncbi:MAG: DUF4147 domain-containing protein [Ardenticatenaceae bacterium]|nr:DUF4147 domain-containing protein [Ardenticatenaceae bacterium]